MPSRDGTTASGGLRINDLIFLTYFANLDLGEDILSVNNPHLFACY